ncbi:hypothetical protein P7K49_024460 [Saguinus oedipus]|uniref:Uncharacterized protein n=1 Tax=Saguinus oedipus TaxID=9490 RepID=A0ABQ9UQD9_SAGOE|nr:hypothetical protein P7K49_024460 [Saguinus oedipus]
MEENGEAVTRAEIDCLTSRWHRAGISSLELREQAPVGNVARTDQRRGGGVAWRRLAVLTPASMDPSPAKASLPALQGEAPGPAELLQGQGREGAELQSSTGPQKSLLHFKWAPMATAERPHFH